MFGKGLSIIRGTASLLNSCSPAPFSPDLDIRRRHDKLEKRIRTLQNNKPLTLILHPSIPCAVKAINDILFKELWASMYPFVQRPAGVTTK